MRHMTAFRCRPLRVVVTLVVCYVFSLPFSPSVFAQAGSAGGIIGKQDKSLSGGVETRNPAVLTAVTSRRRASHGREKAAAGLPITGRWHWHSNCGGERQGTFEISWIDSGRFAGAIANADQSTSTINGRVDGYRISFENTQYAEKWNGILSGGRMDGSVSGVIGGISYACKWTASR